MTKSVMALGIYEFPAPLGVTAGCFNKTIKVKIGGLNAKAILPILEWSGENPRVIAPTMSPDVKKYVENYAKSSSEDLRKEHFWGNVSGWHPKKRKVNKARIGAILLEFKLAPNTVTYSDYLYGRGHPESNEIKALFIDADQWFERVRAWVEAALDQDVDPNNPIPSVEIPGNNLQVLTVEGDTISLPATASNIKVTVESYDRITLPLLRKIIKHANSGVVPNDAHLLLRDSKAALRRKHYRRAVIDAGSATEITIADFNTRVTRVNTGSRPTLGWYVNQPTIASRANLPANTLSDLVDLRNSAIHQNRTPSRAETVLALSLAKQIVDELDPLPL